MTIVENNDSSKNQAGGDCSVNIQAENITLVGISASEARQIALDIYRSNALELAGIARDVAKSRAEQITEKFIKDLSEKNPDGLKQAADPDFQHSLFEAQKSFARSGNQNLEEVLVNLLIGRASEPEKNLKQVVLNEAIQVSSKLTEEQINVLTSLFRVRYTIRLGLMSLEHLAHTFIADLLQFTSQMPSGESVYRYLHYTGLASVELGENHFLQITRHFYPGLCSNGCAIALVQDIVGREPIIGGYFMKKLEDPPEIMRPIIGNNNFKQILLAQGVAEEIANEAVNLASSNPMNDQEILNHLGNDVAAFRTSWDSSLAKQTTLTPVGLAIAHANSTKAGTVNLPLDIWVQ